ncbi:ABC transporter ATP-binding protein [Streptomyces sp. NPDC051183]|uniref:ABC transporter ATP-binding protein n=1 Tax=unclassified Streptomyces TaxID=2593676 RepID=UPI00343C4063
MLVRHSPGTSPRQAAWALHLAVDRALTHLCDPSADGSALPVAAVPAARPGKESGVRRPILASEHSTGRRVRRGVARRTPIAAAGTGVGVAAAVALGCGRLCLGLLAHPLVGLGLAAAATAAIVRRAWRRSDGARPSSGTATRGHPLRRIIGRHKRQFAMATLLSVLSMLAEMTLFALVPSTVLLLARGESATLARLGVAGAKAQLSVLAGAIGLSCLTTTAMGYTADVAWRRLGHTVEDDWRRRTYDHVQALAPADLEDERTSRVTGVLTEDISQLGSFIGSHMHDVVQLVTSIALLIPVYLLLAPQLAWMAFAPIPLVTWLSFRFHERAVADHGVSGEHRTRLNSRIADNLQAHTTVKAACTEKCETSRIAELSRENREANRRTDRSSAAQGQIVRLCAASALSGTLLIGGRAVLNGVLPASAFGPLIEMPGMAVARLSRLGAITAQYQRTLAAFDRVQRLNDLPVEPGTDGRRLPAQQVRGEIELRRVTFAYPGRPPALCDTSLAISPGKVTGIVGATGAGKTTITKLLMRFRHADSGLVLLDGFDVRELALPYLRGAIGYVSQEPFLFDATIAENIRYGTFDATQQQLITAAHTAGAGTFIEALPDGYDTMVGQHGAALSGGQKQRIALARTILKNPPIVILDEATSAVDNETEAAIRHALQSFGVNRTMVVIAHRLSTVRDADQIYVLGPGGVVAEQGTHDDLVALAGTYAGLWSLQAGQRVLS